MPQNIQWFAVPDFSPNLQQKCKKKPPKGTVCGADDGARTRDLRLTKAVRYLLCHISIVSKLAKKRTTLTIFWLLLIRTKDIDRALNKDVHHLYRIGIWLPFAHSSLYIIYCLSANVNNF